MRDPRITCPDDAARFDPVTEVLAEEKYEAWRRVHRSEPAWGELKELVRSNWRIAVHVDRREQK